MTERFSRLVFAIVALWLVGLFVMGFSIIFDSFGTHRFLFWLGAFILLLAIIVACTSIALVVLKKA